MDIVLTPEEFNTELENAATGDPVRKQAGKGNLKQHDESLRDRLQKSEAGTRRFLEYIRSVSLCPPDVGCRAGFEEVDCGACWENWISEGE